MAWDFSTDAEFEEQLEWIREFRNEQIANYADALYFTVTALTTTGFGDIVPVHAVARMLCVIEQVVGVLFIAILIARLAGTLPPVERR